MTKFEKNYNWKVFLIKNRHTCLHPYQGRSVSSNMKFLNFFLLWGPILDPDSQSGSSHPIISGSNPDPKHCMYQNISSIISSLWIILSLQWFDSLSAILLLFGSDKKYGEIFQVVWSDNSVLHGNYSLWTISQVFPTPPPPHCPLRPLLLQLCAVRGSVKVIYTIWNVNYSICSGRRVS
jgi:hypothetical protein